MRKRVHLRWFASGNEKNLESARLYVSFEYCFTTSGGFFKGGLFLAANLLTKRNYTIRVSTLSSLERESILIRRFRHVGLFTRKLFASLEGRDFAVS